MKQAWKVMAALCLLLSAVLLFGGCAPKEEPSDGAAKLPPYDENRLEEYLTPFSYRGLTVVAEHEESKDQAIFAELVEKAEILRYPEEQVSYYERQLKAEYRYLAKQKDMSYESYLSAEGHTEETILAKARHMVKTDLVLLYVVKDAGLALTEEEKTGLYDRYATVYVGQGYDRSYVDEYMRELIYETMLFDKTMEYLVLNNEVRNG